MAAHLSSTEFLEGFSKSGPPSCTDRSPLADPACCAGTSMILLSEIGDKTFFIAALMAMRNSRLAVLAGALAALWIMTALSAFIGKVSSEMARLSLRQLPAPGCGLMLRNPGLAEVHAPRRHRALPLLRRAHALLRAAGVGGRRHGGGAEGG